MPCISPVVTLPELLTAQGPTNSWLHGALWSVHRHYRLGGILYLAGGFFLVPLPQLQPIGSA